MIDKEFWEKVAENWAKDDIAPKIIIDVPPIIVDEPENDDEINR